MDLNRGIKGILFDKDGVLFDFQRMWGAWTETMIVHFAKGDPELEQRLADLLDYDRAGRVFRPGSFAIASTGEEVATALARELPEWDAADLARDMGRMTAQVRAVEAVPLRATLTALRARGLRLGVATNDAEASAKAQLTQVNALDCFDFIAGYDSGYGAKPAPGMCRAFAQSMQMEPKHLVMVGDSTHDMNAGRAAGFSCIGVLTGVAREPDLSPYADVVLPDIGALAGWLGGR